MWTPTHILVTVCKARNLLEKGKGGNDAYCMICMGKEKFLTSVRQKTLSPVWDEQAEFMLTERADLKIKVYHKSSIMDEFVGRVVISVADLFNENNKSFVKWYKLQSREENSKKAAKERGEVEIRVEFITKPKTGSVMDLSSLSKTNKEKTLSLKNLKDKSHTFKHSFRENFKLLGKSKSKSKINEDNQLGEQAKRMNGSRLDFLDGEDMNSLSSSYSSLNGNRLANDKQMHRYNQSRSSFMSGTSSRNDADSIDNSTNNDEEMNEELDESNMSFNRNSSFRRSSLRRPSKKSNKAPQEADNTESKISIAPLMPFSSDQQRHHVLDSIIHEENSAPFLSASNSDSKPEQPSFANIFSSSFSSGQEKVEVDSVKIEPLIIEQESKTEPKSFVAPQIHFSPNSTESATFNSGVTITRSELDASNDTKNSKKSTEDDDDDHIDWASSDEEEIVKEVETFERNQITRQSERRRVVPGQDLTSDLNLNLERESSTNNSFVSYSNVTKSNRSSMKFDFNGKRASNTNDEEIKTPDFDQNYIFQDEQNMKPDEELSLAVNGRGLPDLINQKEPSDKAKKYLEGLDGVKLDEITVPDGLKKQLEYFDRDELLQLIAYQKRHLDLKESRIKDLEIYIDNLVVKILENDPVILMNDTCPPLKNKNYA